MSEAAEPGARRRALDELSAARTLLADPSVVPPCATVHLHRAAAALREAGLPEQAMRLDELDTADGEPRAALRRLAHAIEEAIEPRIGAGRKREQALAAVAILGATLVVGFVVADCKARTPTRWHATSDGNGLHETSCLTLNRRQDILFQVVADGGATLWVDGKAAIDIPARGPDRRVASHRVELDTGAHALRLDYANEQDMTALLASFDGALPVPIPADRLRFPNRPEDMSTPCGD